MTMTAILLASAADEESERARPTAPRPQPFHHDNGDAGAGAAARYDRLTARERDVLRMIAEGYSAPEIGELLSISAKTVDTYKHRINEKLSITHRTEYVRLALRLGILKA